MTPLIDYLIRSVWSATDGVFYPFHSLHFFRFTHGSAEGYTDDSAQRRVVHDVRLDETKRNDGMPIGRTMEHRRQHVRPVSSQTAPVYVNLLVHHGNTIVD